MQWFHHFASQLRDGDIYPRWLGGMNAGYGSPAFFLYAPLPYYAATLCSPLGSSAAAAAMPLGLAAAIALVASGFTCRLWLRRRASAAHALAGALLYMAIPYHLVVDLYDRAAFAEFCAFVWLPLVLHFAEGIARGERRAAPSFALAYAALAATHLPTTLIATPLALAAGAILAGREPRARGALPRVAGACALGAALAALYLAPAIASQRHVLIVETPADPRYFANNFLFDFGRARAYGEYLARLGALTALTLGFAAGAFFFARGEADPGARRARLFWLAALAAATVMMVPLSRAVWNAAPPLQTIQFPWRFHAIVCVAVAALAARACAASARGRAFVLAGALLFAGLAAQSGWRALAAARKTDARFAAASVEVGMEGRQFRPRWVNLELFTRAPLAEIVRGAGTAAIAGGGDGTASAERRGPRAFALRAQSAAGTTLVVQHFYYPGWQARLAATGEPLATEPSRGDGLIAIRVPAGEHEIALRLETSALEKLGALVSALAAAIVAFLLLRGANAPAEAAAARSAAAAQASADPSQSSPSGP